MSKASSVTMYYAVREMMAAFDGVTTAGEIGLIEQSAGRYLSTAIYARWKSHRLVQNTG